MTTEEEKQTIIEGFIKKASEGGSTAESAEIRKLIKTGWEVSRMMAGKAGLNEEESWQLFKAEVIDGSLEDFKTL